MLTAKSYLDTVSIIRGKYGRGPLKEEERIYFMNQKIDISGPGSLQTNIWYQFSFVLQSNIDGEELVESYIGVDFSILVRS